MFHTVVADVQAPRIGSSAQYPAVIAPAPQAAADRSWRVRDRAADVVAAAVMRALSVMAGGLPPVNEAHCEMCESRGGSPCRGCARQVTVTHPGRAVRPEATWALQRFIARGP